MRMTAKPFTLEWYAKKYLELTEENEQLKQQLKPIQKVCEKYRIPIKDLPEILEEYIAYDNDDDW